MSSESRFAVPGMDCPTEEKIIRSRLAKETSVRELEVDLMNRQVLVKHDAGARDAVTKALGELGLGAKLLPVGATAGAPIPAAPLLQKHAALAMSGVAALAAEIVVIATSDENGWVVIGLSLGSIALGGRTTLMKGAIAIKNVTLTIHFLMAVAVAGALVLSQWPEAAMVTFLFGLAEAIEGYAMDRARDAISKLVALAPQTASVARGGAFVDAPVEQVNVDDVVRVRAGDRVPLDGVVTSGDTTVNQAPITGESAPVVKGKGDAVFAGSINEEGSIDVRVTARGEESTLARIARAVTRAQSDKPAAQRFVDRFSRVYTPVVVVFAAVLGAAGPFVFGGSHRESVYRALVLLVIACPCALVISTPVTVVSALAAAAKRGILVKGGAYLEAARAIAIVAVDKTGTLTKGEPEVTDVVALGDLDEKRVSRLAASLNAHSEHPLARAMRRTSEEALLDVDDFAALPGRGVRGTIEGRVHFIGSHRLAEENQICSTEVEAMLEKLELEGKTATVLSTDTEVLGIIAVADALKPSSVAAVKSLHALGVRVVMMTGDNERTAKTLALAVGVDDVRAEMLPETKLEHIAELVKGGPTAMVGDGVNDAPALARATIGIAMGRGGSAVAIETADVTLMNDDLRRVPELIRLGKKTAAVLTQNIAFALGTKALFFGLALFGVATLWMAVFADMGASLLVVANGLRMLRSPHDKSPAEDHAHAHQGS